MNKKISIGLCVALVIMSITATFSITMVVSKQIYNKIISNISQRSQTYESVDEISQLISNYYYGTVDDPSINAALAEGYINGLTQGENVYLNASEYAAYTSKLESGVTGIGVETAFNYQTNEFTVTYVYENSPAEKAGLKVLDVITAINNTAVHLGNYSQISEQLYGSMLSSVRVEFERDGVTKVVEPMLGFEIPSIRSNLEGSVGYIKISGFYKNTASEFKQAVEKLIEDGATSLLFDVRNTSDGSIDYAAQVIDVIVPTVNIAVAKDKNGATYKNKVYTAESSSISGVSFAVLINGNTKGSAELFACDLRDISQAALVGEKTAGIGTMQELFALEDGGAVLLTVALIEPKAGSAAVYDKVGVEPTVTVNMSQEYSANLELLTTEQDTQLSAALNMLAG